MDRQLSIGTSGWMYKHWKERFYPDGLGQREWLQHYASEFKSAEINNSFYKLPSEETFEKWAEKVPADFIFAVKASRYLTHMKKLKDPLEPWLNVTSHAEHLGEKLGPILLQFPQRWAKNIERLRAFLEVTKSVEMQHPIAFEFRNESWFDKEIYKLLEQYDAALCIADSDKFIRVDVTTCGYTYLRYHGRGETIYAAKYTEDELKKEAKLIRKFLKQGLRVYVYFDNDGNAHAVRNALELQEMLAA